MAARRRALLLPLLLALIGLSVAACSPGRSMEAMSLLSGIAGGSVPEDVQRAQVNFVVDGRTREGDLYSQPDETARAGLVIVPGASPEGRDEPRLVAFAATMADAGFLVLVPEIANLRQLNITSSDTLVIADALRHLADRQGTGQPLGAVGVSYAVAPTTLAAHEPDLRERVDMVVSIGGYYDSDAVATFFTTGRFRDPDSGDWRFLEPNSFGKWVFVRANANRVDSPQDRVVLTAMADRRLRQLDADLDDLVARLGPEGRAIYDFLENRDPERAPELLAALPEGVRAEMTALDLSARDLTGAGPEMILVHGRNDAIIPYTESLALAEAVSGSEGGKRARLYLLDGLDHADPTTLSLGDTITLIGAVYRVLEIRDAE